MAKKKVVVSIALVLGFFGFLLTFFAIERLVFEHSARAWPTVPGTIRSAEVITSDGRGGRSWCARWTYDYSVDGKSFVGTRRTFGGYSCHKGPKTAEKEALSYPVGAQVSVIYQPDEPKRAALSASENSSFFWWFLTALGATFILMAIGLFLKAKMLESGHRE